MSIHPDTLPPQGGWFALIKCCSPTPRYWLGWTAVTPKELLFSITLASPYPVELLWSQPGDEDAEEDLTYPYIQYWLPDTDWFELPQSAVNKICAKEGQG